MISARPTPSGDVLTTTGAAEAGEERDSKNTAIMRRHSINMAPTLTQPLKIFNRISRVAYPQFSVWPECWRLRPGAGPRHGVGRAFGGPPAPGARPPPP